MHDTSEQPILPRAGTYPVQLQVAASEISTAVVTSAVAAVTSTEDTISVDAGEVLTGIVDIARAALGIVLAPIALPIIAVAGFITSASDFGGIDIPEWITVPAAAALRVATWFYPEFFPTTPSPAAARLSSAKVDAPKSVSSSTAQKLDGRPARATHAPRAQLARTETPRTEKPPRAERTTQRHGSTGQSGKAAHVTGRAAAG